MKRLIQIEATDEIERKISGIIETLAIGPEMKGLGVFIAVSYIVGFSLSFFLFQSKMVSFPNDVIDRIFIGSLVLIGPAVPAMLWHGWKETKLVKLSARKYQDFFQSTNEQLNANTILLEATSQCSERRLVLAFARKVGAITKRFTCSECGKYIKSKSFSYPTLVCDHCDSDLVANIFVACPQCGSNDVNICSPHELVGPMQEDETTKGLFVIGQLLDLIYYPFRLAFHSAHIYFKSHQLMCQRCSEIWAVKLPATSEIERTHEER